MPRYKRQSWTSWFSQVISTSQNIKNFFKNIKKKYSDLSLESSLTRHTLVAESLPENLPQDKVKYFIKITLIYLKLNISYQSLDDFIDLKSISKILAENGIKEEQYENVLKISDDNDFQIHLRRRLTDFYIINNYFDINLLT